MENRDGWEKKGRKVGEVKLRLLYLYLLVWFLFAIYFDSA